MPVYAVADGGHELDGQNAYGCIYDPESAAISAGQRTQYAFEQITDGQAQQSQHRPVADKVQPLTKNHWRTGHMQGGGKGALPVDAR